MRYDRRHRIKVQWPRFFIPKVAVLLLEAYFAHTQEEHEAKIVECILVLG